MGVAQGAIAGDISIHALLAESDRPTLYPLHRQQHFYPRSPCGERPVKLFRQNYECFISIHALLAESDSSIEEVSKYVVISIHALLAESDPLLAYCQGHIKNFYPRSPCGERRTSL